jgi:uncharacterized phiE125 gp8 family phage protein
MLSPTLITAPALEAVTLAEAKAHLRVDVAETDADAGIQEMIDAAVEYLDGFAGVLGRAVMTQTWSQEYDGYCGHLVLPIGPVQSVTSISNTDGAFADYRLLKDGRGYFLRPNSGVSWPANNGPVVVEFVAGDVVCPSGIKGLIKLHVGTMFAVRESVDFDKVQPNKAYEAILARYRLVRV